MTRKSPQTSANRDSGKPLSLVGSEKQADPTPKPRRFAISTMRGIRREMGRVYRQAARGDLDLAEACRLAYLLTTLRQLSEAELLEARLTRLEEKLDEERRP